MQSERRTENPYTDVLAEHLDEFEGGGLRSTDVWKLLGIPPDRQHPNVIEQVHDAMRQLGWGRRKTSNGAASHGRDTARAWRKT